MGKAHLTEKLKKIKKNYNWCLFQKSPKACLKHTETRGTMYMVEAQQEYKLRMSEVEKMMKRVKSVEQQFHDIEDQNLQNTQLEGRRECIVGKLECKDEIRKIGDQMCEQAAEAHKSKGSGHLSRRSRMSADSNQVNKSSVDAILNNSNTVSAPQSTETPSKIFLINCLCAIQQPLVGHEAAAKYAKNIGDMIENHMRILVDKQVETLLRCNLFNKMPNFRKTFDEASEEVTASPPLAEFEQLQVPKLRSEACIQLARSLADAYQLIYNL